MILTMDFDVWESVYGYLHVQYIKFGLIGFLFPRAYGLNTSSSIIIIGNGLNILLY